MGYWRYRFKPIGSTEIRSGLLEMMDDDDRLEVIERIQDLRIALAGERFEFIDANPISGAELLIERRLAGLRCLKQSAKPKRKIVKKLPASTRIRIALLMLFALLLLLLVAWHLCT